jgi:threonine dehydrogenase-like Zn-dependent dehydrogenase
MPTPSVAVNKTMRAIVFHGPGKVGVEERPIPQILEPTDIVARVEYAGLCGT